MNVEWAPLFEPLQIRQHTLRNRIVMPPMVVNRDLTAADGWEWYGRHAEGGAGLVIVQSTDVPRFGTEYTAENLRPLADAIHRGGALAAIQLYPGLRLQRRAPADLTLSQIDELVAGYRLAAGICAEAGFDGVEPHGANGYVLNQFFSPELNLRTDGYGVTLVGRMRMALEIVAAISPVAAAAGMLLLYRHNPVGPGYGVSDSVAFAAKLVAAGVDVLDLAHSSESEPGDLAAAFMTLGVPVIAVGELDGNPGALDVLRAGRATLVAVGRGLIADPEWPLKVREGRLSDIVACTRCDQCYDDVTAGVPVSCVQWG